MCDHVACVIYNYDLLISLNWFGYYWWSVGSINFLKHKLWNKNNSFNLSLIP